MQRALPKRPRVELEAFCSCTETRARADGATGAVDCRLQEVRTRERRDRQLWMRDVMRTLDCPGADVTITGTQIAPDHTGCSHSRDGAIGIEGRARFEVRPRSGNAPGGMLSLACERIDR